MNPLDTQFHRAQSRLKSNPPALTTHFRGGQDVRPAFSADDEDFFDIPAALRRKAARLAGRDAADGSRMMDYGARYTHVFKRLAWEAHGFRVQTDGERLEVLNDRGEVLVTEYGEAA